MSQTPPDVILYRYDRSPFSAKIEHVLSLKQIPHKRVNVSNILPRPEITRILGLVYRQIPVLAIGNDLYCDTSLIASALERRFPASQDYGSIFPPKKSGGNPDTGFMKAFARHYMDNIVFRLAIPLAPWDKLPQSFIDDRSKMFGAPIDPKAFVKSRNKSLSLLTSHLTFVEEQLSDGREWVFDTISPSFGDISVYFVLNWTNDLLQRSPGELSPSDLFDSTKFANTITWMDRLRTHMQSMRIPILQIDGEEAANDILRASYEPYEVVGFDQTEGRRLGLTIGQLVSVVRDDVAKDYPTPGKLVALNAEECVLEVQGEHGITRCHFPRIGFSLNSQLPGDGP